MFAFPLVALVLAFLHILIDRKARTLVKILEILLTYLLVITVGCAGLFAFLGHAFQPDLVAKSIGWPTGSPFQFEVAVANLAFGVLGILCIWLRGGFWLATGIGSAVFLLGAAYGHLRDITLHHNLAANNAGAVLWLGDIILPLVLVGLLIVYTVLMNKAAGKKRKR